MNIERLIKFAKETPVTKSQVTELKKRLSQPSTDTTKIKEIYPTYRDFQTTVGGSEVYDNSVCRDHFPKLPNSLGNFSFSTYDVDNMVNNLHINFLVDVESALAEYFKFKYNANIEEIKKVSKNVNNFKLNQRFQKVSTLSEGVDRYYDRGFLFMTTVLRFGESGNIIKHWLEE